MQDSRNVSWAFNCLLGRVNAVGGDLLRQFIFHLILLFFDLIKTALIYLIKIYCKKD